HEVEGAREAKLLTQKMGLCPRPSRGETVFAGIGSDQIDKLLHGLRGHCRVDREHMGGGDGERDRCEAFERVVRDLREQRWIYHEGAECKQYRVAVGSSPGRLASTDVAGGARYVLDIELLSEPLAQFLSNDPGEDIDG